MSDIPIDRINKPFLPLASGAMTLSDARLTVTIALILSLAFCLAPAATPALRAVLIGSAALGTLYSAPPFRLKRFALLASISILTVRGLLVNLGFFLHASSTPLPLPAPVTFATIFFTLFGIVIALLKDVPDISGDAQFGIRTFSVTLGAPIIFRTCQALLSIMFVIAAAFYYSVSRSLLGGILVAVTHLLVAAYLAYRGNKVDPKEASQVKDFYMFSWKTFYLEYLLLPLAMI